MWSKRSFSFARLFVGGWLLCAASLPLQAQQVVDANKPVTRPTTEDDRQIEIRYAQAYLKLMEATLAKYEEMNRQQPNAVRPTVMQTMRTAVDKARDRLRLVDGGAVDASQIFLVRAESELRLAERELSKAEMVNRERAGTISQGEVERLKAERDFAAVKLEKARRLPAASPEFNLRYELDELREELQELKMHVGLLRAGRG